MASKSHTERSADRRKQPAAGFPLVLPGGAVVKKERRTLDRRKLGFISRMELFHGVPYAAIEETLATSPVREIATETVLLRPGEENSRVFLVLEGTVRVHLDHSDSQNWIHIGPGACIGEMSIIDGKPVSAFAVAEAGSRILEIEQNRFWNNIVSHPLAMRNLLAVLSERMRRNDRAVLKGMQNELMLEHIRKELKLASEIQRSMLPRPSVLSAVADRFDVHAMLEPARTVGGDLYDFFVTPRGRLCFLVGDVSDKGVPAALFMARAVDIVRVVTRLTGGDGRDDPDPAWILGQANGELCENNESGMFVTLLLAILDPASRKLSYCNAGHVAPRLRRDGDGITRLEGRRSPPLGVSRKASYGAATVGLEPGDLVFVCTDGVTEAENAANELFGEERMEQALAAPGLETAEALIAAVIREVHAYAGEGRPPSDDITALAVRLL
jgi:sigma-B regulation protein RsbU (phosphoserine phosphatase)